MNYAEYEEEEEFRPLAQTRLGSGSTPGTAATVPPQNDQQEEVKPQRWGTVTFEYLGMVRLAAVAFSFETSGMVRWAAMGKERDRGEMWACMHAEEGRDG